MIEFVGVLFVLVFIINFGLFFNNGSVDIIGVLVIVYNVLEFYKGLGENGVVVKFLIL